MNLAVDLLYAPIDFLKSKFSSPALKNQSVKEKIWKKPQTLAGYFLFLIFLLYLIKGFVPVSKTPHPSEKETPAITEPEQTPPSSNEKNDWNDDDSPLNREELPSIQI